MPAPCRTSTSTWAGGARSGLGYWPLPEDDPGVDDPAGVDPAGDPRRRARAGPAVDPAGRWPWKTAVILSHPRGDFSVHYACPLLAAAGYAVCGFGTRYMDNDTDCLHEQCIVDVETVVRRDAPARRRGRRAARQLGRRLADGAGPRRARRSATAGSAWPPTPARACSCSRSSTRRWPTRTTRSRRCPSSTCTTPTTGGGRGRSRARTTTAGWRGTARPSVDRVARIDADRQGGAADGRGRRASAATPSTRRPTRRGASCGPAAVFTKYLMIYRTLADPAYLDLSIDPDERPLGSLFAFPDPLDANYGRGGLARTMTARGWLSTWSGLSSHAKLADTMPQGDGADAARAPDGRHRDPGVAGQGDRRQRRRRGQDLRRDEGRPALPRGPPPEALAVVADWLAKRFP